MKLENAVSTGWMYDYAMIQDRTLFIGVHVEVENGHDEDTVVLMYKDMGSWELAANCSEDAFHFLYRHLERHSRRMYGAKGDPFYKDFIVIAVNASLTLPHRPEYRLRDVWEENDRAKWKGDEKQVSSFLKMRDWLERLPISGSSKRVFLETHAESNFPVQLSRMRNKEMEMEFIIESFKKMLECKGQHLKVKGWKKAELEHTGYRDAFISMLVAMAYGRWKSQDKSGVNDYLKLVADHDGLCWLLDHDMLAVK